MGEQRVTFRLRALAIDDHIDQVAHMHLDIPIRLQELLDRNQTFGFVPKIDDYVGGMNAYDTALQQLAFVGWFEMRIVFDELLVVRFFSGHGRV